MPFVLSRRVTIHSLAAIVAGALTSARAATPAPTYEPAGIHVPHFGKSGIKTCNPRGRERIRAIMNGNSAGRSNDQPRGSNSPCG